jgi:cytochrome b561
MIILLSPLQAIIAHKPIRPAPASTRRSSWFLSHAFLGISIFALGVAQIFIGIVLWQVDQNANVDSFIIGAAVAYGALMLLALVLEVMGRVAGSSGKAAAKKESIPMDKMASDITKYMHKV